MWERGCERQNSSSNARVRRKTMRCSTPRSCPDFDLVKFSFSCTDVTLTLRTLPATSHPPPTPAHGAAASYIHALNEFSLIVLANLLHLLIMPKLTLLEMRVLVHLTLAQQVTITNAFYSVTGWASSTSPAPPTGHKAMVKQRRLWK